ncbi:DNA primase [Synechococcus phage MA01]
MFTEIKYLNMLSPRLEQFKRKKDFLWNFRCPVCGDSQKHRNKARGFVFQVKGDLIYKCHNCQLSLPLAKFIEIMDPMLYKEYKLEKFKENNTARQLKPKVDMRKVKRVVSAKPTFKVDHLRDLETIDSLNNSHPAKEYLLNRKLPTEALYYTEKFKEWTNSVKSGAFEDLKYDEPRIIIPFRDKDGTVFGFQGRSLSSTGLRYITILLEEDRTKIFGLERVDTTKRVFVVEGPFDSLLLDNAVAMAGADVSLLGNTLGKDVVYVYDNEPRNKQITARIQKHIKAGEQVVIWPREVKEKDVNDMVLAGRDVNSVVKSNVYHGLKSTLKFNEWKK